MNWNDFRKWTNKRPIDINGHCYYPANRGHITSGKAETTHTAHFSDALIGHIGFQVNRNFCAWIPRPELGLLSLMSPNKR